ncbi:MAG: M28 family peptidase [Desulfurococcaceae archaeon]
MGFPIDPLKEISLSEVMKHVVNITNIGQKLAGSAEESIFVDYIRKTLDSYGVKYEVYEHPGYVSRPSTCELEVIHPVQLKVPCRTYAHSAQTPEEGIEGEVVYVGAGGLEDYLGKSVSGKITLAELSYAPPRPEKVRIAQERGAIAQIQINWGLEERRILPYGTVKSIWGLPTRDQVNRITRIPALAVTKADGKYLKEVLDAHGSLKVRLKTVAWSGYMPIHDIVAYIDGAVDKKFVVVHGHYDCWGPGATDNATGNALLLELARVFNELKGSMKRGLRVAWWSGHETGIMSGSSWYVDNFWDELREGCVAWINVDSPGMKGTDKFMVRSSEELQPFWVKIIRSADKSEPEEVLRVMKVGDQSVLGVGVPSASVNTMFPRDVIIREVGRYTPVYLGWWYHSDEDTLDKVDEVALERSIKVHVSAVHELTTAPILPYDFSKSTNVVREAFREAETRMSEAGIILGRFKKCMSSVEKLSNYSSILNDLTSSAAIRLDSKLVEKLNALLIKYSRTLVPMLYVYDVRYRQDPYGLSYLNFPVPKLQVLRDLLKVEKSSPEHVMILTEYTRNINELCDMIDELIEYTSMYLY